MENVTVWHFQTLWCVADRYVARRKRSQRYSCCHFPFVVSVIVASLLSCCCITSKKKKIPQHLPKNRLWLKIKDFLTPQEGQHPVHGSFVCRMQRWCVALARLLPTAAVWPAGRAAEERLHRCLTRQKFIFGLIHKTEIFFRHERKTAGFWGRLIISASTDFPCGWAKAATEPSGMNWLEVLKESKTKTHWLKTFVFPPILKIGLIRLTFRNWMWVHSFSFCPLVGNICVQWAYRARRWQHLGTQLCTCCFACACAHTDVSRCSCCLAAVGFSCLLLDSCCAAGDVLRGQQPPRRSSSRRRRFLLPSAKFTHFIRRILDLN